MKVGVFFMKTRIIYTKIHFEDDWFNTLPIGYRYLFIYLFTNSHIGITGIYELPKRVAILETGADPKIWKNACRKFEKERRVIFYKDWICVVNANKYNRYVGEKNEIAYEKEINIIPGEVTSYLDTLSIPYAYPYNHNHNHNPYKKDNNILNKELNLEEIDKHIKET